MTLQWEWITQKIDNGDAVRIENDQMREQCHSDNRE